MDAHAERRRAKDEADTAVARRLFIAGCFLLPWLWIVMLVHFRKRIFDKDAPPMLRKYLHLSIAGAVVMTALFIAWVTVFQTTWPSWGSSLLVYSPNSGWWYS